MATDSLPTSRAANGSDAASENGKKSKVDKRKERKKQQKAIRRERWCVYHPSTRGTSSVHPLHALAGK